MPIKAEVKAEIKRFLAETVRRTLHNLPESSAELRASSGELKPFHEALLGRIIARISSFERSFSTKLGTTFEECARLIAQNYHKDCQREYSISAEVPEEAVSRVASLIQQSSGVSKSLTAMIDEVLPIRASPSQESFQTIHAKSDIYILTKSGHEIFMELKSPKPNKDQCEQAIRRILYIHLIRNQKRPQVRGYLALPYNPFGNTREDYQWSITRRYLPDEALLIGEEFWEIIGGKGTYNPTFLLPLCRHSEPKAKNLKVRPFASLRVTRACAVLPSHSLPLKHAHRSRQESWVTYTELLRLYQEVGQEMEQEIRQLL